MIKWIRTSRLSIKNSLSLKALEADTQAAPPDEEEVDPGVVEGTDLRVLKSAPRIFFFFFVTLKPRVD